MPRSDWDRYDRKSPPEHDERDRWFDGPGLYPGTHLGVCAACSRAIVAGGKGGVVAMSKDGGGSRLYCDHVCYHSGRDLGQC